MTGAEALRQAVERLKEAGIDDPARDARRLLAHALDIAPGRLTLVLPEPLTDANRTGSLTSSAAVCRANRCRT